MRTVMKGAAGRSAVAAAVAALMTAALLQTAARGNAVPAPPTPVTISQIPLTVAIPAHPQVLLAISDSQSMDGNLSGAIMTGSGSLSITGASYLGASSSPVNYTIPAGFTPPLNAGSSGQAPYTVNIGGTLYDNSPSRLNVAKAGITAILNTYMEYADFALMDYSTSSLGKYTTWVYDMSPNGSGFTFTNSPGSNRYVANPCYNANVLLSDQYDQACLAMLNHYGIGSGVIVDQYMLIDASSDDPLINDVLYAPSGYEGPICVSGSPVITNIYTHFTLSNYNNQAVSEGYGSHWGPGGYSVSCVAGMYPTNAAYVPYSHEVMLIERGWAYDASSQSATTGNLVVPMQSSGAAPTSASVNAAIAVFTPYLKPETNNTGSTEIKAVGEQSPLAGMMQGAKNYFTGTNPSSSNGCTATRYIVLVTDGLPTKDLAGHAWPPLGSVSASGWSVTASFNADGSLNSTNDQALTDTIAQITAAKAAGIKTYVIGLGAGVDPSNNPVAASTLTAMAVAGGTGSYFPATSPSNLTNAMQVILAQILAAVQSTSSATVNTTGLNTSSLAFQPSFDTSDTNQDWTGDLKAYPIDPATGLVNTSALNWSAQAKLDLLAAGTGWDTGRIIATWDPVAGAGIPFRWSPGNPPTGISAATTLGQELETSTCDANGMDALDYLRGDTQHTLANTGGCYRIRTHILGDIVDSAPLYVGAAAGPYQSSSYYAFEAAHANRQPVIYAGANDGMLHAFSATSGQELFAYIPNGVFANLNNLSNVFYNQRHHFYVDGSPQASDVQFNDGSWHTVLVGGERAGGSSIYALDVTDPMAITTESTLASKVLWEFSDSNMGLTFSTPAIAQTAAGASSNYLGFTAFFGNGYNSPAQKPYLYAINPQTGALLPGMPIDLCAQVTGACNTALPNGLSNVVVTNNLGGIGSPATTVYAGDLQGNLWRVDIRNADSTRWVVTLLFQATDGSGNRQPITTTPLVSLNPYFPRLAGTMVYVGTGQMLGIPDLSSTLAQTMYAVYDSGSNSEVMSRSNLIGQSMSATTAGTANVRLVSGHTIQLPSQNGWYSDFTLPPPAAYSSMQLAAERIVTDARLEGGAVVVTSVAPSSNSCAGGDLAYLMEFNFAGGSFNNPQFNYDGTGSVTSSLAAVNGVLLGSVYASAPVFSDYAGASGSNGAGGSVALVTESDGSIRGYAERGLQQQRFAWWDVQ